MDSIGVWKLVSIFTTLLAAILGIWISFYFRKSKFFTIGCAIASGVLLATGLTHSLPEGVEGLESWSSDYLNGYPFAYLLAALSIGFLALLEEGIHSYFEHKHQPAICEHGPELDAESQAEVPKEQESLQENHHHHIHPDALTETSAVFVFLALSIHAILEGMATGAASDVDGLYGTLIAILIHKGLAAFALGASLVEAEVATYRLILYGGIFSLGTPIGIIIGWLGSLGEDSAGIFGGIANSLAAGTFIYVSTMEFMPLTFKSNRDRFLIKALMFIIGFTLMAILPIWSDVHDHGELDDGHDH
ncbi:hypothetical protein FOL47_007713 [Perkinsus chesapeaki]|uniref:Zinc transporter n=1 Tax=Perkinsus chesapeaki TaxID=330153 RepID=A0A7J6LJ16_PERCH|nr:hypothetical protein FOL47_007713 [Perkinsus chesapeaki]